MGTFEDLMIILVRSENGRQSIWVYQLSNDGITTKLDLVRSFYINDF